MNKIFLAFKDIFYLLAGMRKAIKLELSNRQFLIASIDEWL